MDSPRAYIESRSRSDIGFVSTVIFDDLSSDGRSGAVDYPGAAVGSGYSLVGSAGAVAESGISAAPIDKPSVNELIAAAATAFGVAADAGAGDAPSSSSRAAAEASKFALLNGFVFLFAAGVRGSKIERSRVVQ